MARQWAHIPAEPGVYLLYSGSECVYIGCSTNMQQRISCHNLRGKFDRAECLPMAESEIKNAEKQLIHIYWPRYNNFKGWYWVPAAQEWTPIQRRDNLADFRKAGFCTAVRKCR